MTDPRPFDYAIDADAGLAYGRMWGCVSGGDMLALTTAVHGDAAWRDSFDTIWDCSRVTAHVVAADEVRPLVRDIVESGPGRDALVESPAVGESAISQMLAAFSRRSGKDMTVHASVEAALAALGRDALPSAMAKLRPTPTR